MMDPARRAHTRPGKQSHNQLLPGIARLEEEASSPPYTTSSASYSPGVRYEASPLGGQRTPRAFLVNDSQRWEQSGSGSRPTPPPAMRGVGSLDATSNEIGSSRDSGRKPSASSASPTTAGRSRRVRTGCLTCRERHLKCDEGAPECNNCRKSNRACRRGLRLNFIDIQVRELPRVAPTTEWSVQILDESRAIASEYKGGLDRYPRVVPSPAQTDPAATPSRQGEPADSQLSCANLTDTNRSIESPRRRDPCPANEVGQPPPRMPTNLEGGLPARERADTASLSPHVASKSQPSAAGSGENAFRYASLRQDGAVHWTKSESHDAKSQDGLSAIPRFAQPPLYYGPGQHGTLIRPITLPSEDRPEERDYLSNDEEIHLMQVFADEVCVWLDALNKDKHFSTTVPYLGLKLPMLLNAMLACGSKHLALTGAHGGEKADYYYGMATAQLRRSQQTRDRELTECALTAVVLNAYDIMGDRPTQTIGQIASTRVLIRDCGWDASSSGLGAACFWANVGMDVLACLSLGWKTAWDPDQWGLDLEFATLGAASRSGTRSVAGSEDVWSARAENRLSLGPESGDEQAWLHRIFYIMAKVANFHASTPQFQEPSPHDEQRRLQNRFAEWRGLQNMCNAWNLNCPRSMRPYGYSPGPSSTSLFPNVWLITPTAKLGRTFYHTAMCLLAHLNPLNPLNPLTPLNPLDKPHDNTVLAGNSTTRDESRASQLHHAHHVCGIVAHAIAPATITTTTTPTGASTGTRTTTTTTTTTTICNRSTMTHDNRGVVAVALRCLAAVCTVALVDRREEQAEVLGVLDRVAGETGWRLGRVVGELKAAWRWDENKDVHEGVGRGDVQLAPMGSGGGGAASAVEGSAEPGGGSASSR